MESPDCLRERGILLKMPKKFQRLTKQVIGNCLIRSTTNNAEFQRVHYEEVQFLKRHFNKCTWSDCRFRRTSFRSGTRFEDCVFENCKFELAHTCLGGLSFFKKCQFKNCTFDGVQFWKSSFERCSFSSKLINVVFYGPEAPRGWQTELRDVDFSQSQFELVDFRCGIDLSTTRFPQGYVPENVPCRNT